MNADEQDRFKLRYAKLQRALKLQGMAKATTNAYTRAARRTAEFFDCCPDDLTAEELKEYFAARNRSVPHEFKREKPPTDHRVLNFTPQAAGVEEQADLYAAAG